MRRQDFNYVFMDDNILVITHKLVKREKLFKHHKNLSIETYKVPVKDKNT